MCADTARPTPPSDDETPDYRNTVFLPETEFPMRAGLPQREPDWLARWERIGVYDRLREKAAGRQPFTLHDGPPYANGHLHIGHALNKVLKDMVVRSQQMMGRDARYVPGWDCHGLPIEWKIEEQYRAKGLNKDDVDVVAFRQECRRFAEGWVDVQREEFKRLGVTGNWADPYLTMAYHAEAVIAAEFMTFLMNGSLYQGSKPVMWSPVEKTALAEAEVEYHDHTSHQVWVPFKVVVVADGLRTGDIALDQDATAHRGPDLDHHAVDHPAEPRGRLQSGDRLWPLRGDGPSAGQQRDHRRALSGGRQAGRSRSLLRRSWMRRCIGGLSGVSAEELGGLVLAHPFRGIENGNGEWDYDVPMLPGDHVTDDAGTGFVHTAPSPRR